MTGAQNFTLRVAIMNDHASSLSAWLSALDPANDAPATVLHVDRHADLASPMECDAQALPRHDNAAWARCSDRAGFQLAAAWLGLVDRVWWLKPGRNHGRSFWRGGTVAPAGLGRGRQLLRRAGSGAPSPSTTAAALAVRVSGLHELAAASTADIRGPLLLDIDLDFWGGAAGPQMPTWELASLRACAEYLHECGSAAWGDMRETNGDQACPTTALWPSLLGLGRDCATGGASGEGESADSAAEAHGNASTLLGQCSHALRRAAPARPPFERLLLRRAHALGLTPPEALLAAAPASGEADGCGRVASRRLARVLRSLRPARPRLVTVARSIDGFLPFRCAERLEAAVLRAVRMAFNATALVVEYMPGTAPAEALRGMSAGAR